MKRAKPLGLVAGSGQLPVLLARETAGSRPLIVAAISNEPQPELERRSEFFERTAVGKASRIMSIFESQGATELAIIGGAQKSELFKPRRLDWLALKILAKAKTRGDQSLFAAIAAEFESRGMKIADQRTYLPSLTLTEGVLTRRKPSRAQRADAEYALHLARSAAALDIGQTAVVKSGAPVAIEGMEGTDAAVRRGGELAGKGVVVGKACRPDHDFRFDTPTAGLKTLDALIEAKADALALEAGRVFMLDREAFTQKADRAGIVVFAPAPSN